MSNNNKFIKVLCPGADKACDAELIGVAISHHALISIECPHCRSIWRIFHNSNSEIVEFTRIPVLAEADHQAIPLVHYSVKG
jgi:ribosomal protein S27E